MTNTQRALFFVLATLWSCAAHSEGPLPSAGPPQWFTDDIAANTHEGGRWLADNSKYKSDQEPWDYYVMQWRAGPANASMAGQLSALANGKPSSADFWLFGQYWDPARKTAVLQQSGWGVTGIGDMTGPNADGVSAMEQVFTSYDGNARREGHRVKWIDEFTHDTWSYSWDEKGNEVAGRYYRWVHDSKVPQEASD